MPIQIKEFKVRKILVSIIVLTLSFAVYGQQQTLIGGDIQSGGYGGPEVKIARINGDWEVLLGGRGGWIINHQYILGGAGYGMPTKGEIGPHLNPPRNYEKFEIGYGGVLIGYVSESNKLLHFTVDVLIGGGGISNGIGESYDEYGTDAFFIAEPNINFVLNVTPIMRFGFGAGYRFTSGVEYFGLEDADIRGESLNLFLKFGKF
jgi:hypothetical protein